MADFLDTLSFSDKIFWLIWRMQIVKMSNMWLLLSLSLVCVECDAFLSEMLFENIFSFVSSAVEEQKTPETKDNLVFFT